MNRQKALYILGRLQFELIYGEAEQRDLAELADILGPPLTPESARAHPDLLTQAEVVFSGWGAPRLNADFLSAAPNLKAFFYGAGATSGLIYPEAWKRGIVVSSAYAINGVPVAEFTLAAVIFGLKHALRFMHDVRTQGAYPAIKGPVPGAYHTTIGLVSFGAIGRLVRERLRFMDVNILVYDPFLTPEQAVAAEVTLVSLSELFQHSEVISVHTPWLPETERLITGAHFAAMKPGATLINTARGAIIAENEMISVLIERPDLTAFLDVTHPEPPVPGSPLYTLPNVHLTPHIAGSMDNECRRMGRFMVDEYRRYVQGKPLQGQVLPASAYNTSHRPPVHP